MMTALHDLGVRLHVDDFVSGHSFLGRYGRSRSTR